MKERIWRGSQSSYLRILPSLLGVHHRGYTLELQRAMSDFGLDHSFRGAVAKIKEHYGVEMPASSLRKITVKHANRIAADAARADETGNSLPALGVETLVAETDGSMVPVVEFGKRHRPDKRKGRKVLYREARLCACQSVGAAQTVYRARIAPPEEVGILWNQCAKAAGRGLNTFVHAVADGAPWIKKQAREVLHYDRFLLDFFHLCDYLKAAEPTCAKNNRWFATQKNRLKSNRSQLLLKELSANREPSDDPDEEAPVRSAHRYIDNRLEDLDYRGALQQDLPIGSGLIESGHKHVIQARLKIAGAAWTQDNADAFIQTRAVRANGAWQQCWEN